MGTYINIDNAGFQRARNSEYVDASVSDRKNNEMKQDMIQDMTQSIINDMNIEIVRKMISVANLLCGSTARFAVRLMLLLAIVGGSATTTWADGVKVHGNVYGGGNLATVGKAVTVNISAGEVQGDVYGGGALANTNTDNWQTSGSTSTFVQTYHAVTLTAGTSLVGYYKEKTGGYEAYTEGTAVANTTYYKKNETIVNLTGGEVKGDVYGGGLGYDDTDDSKDVSALVYGDVTVTINGANAKARDVFGANNVKGSPIGVIAVNVNNTHNDGVRNVYGGGNLATYQGTSITVTMTGGKAANVYGGGNLADVSGAVTVNIQGGTVTTDVYGGGALASTNTEYWVNNALVYQYQEVELTAGASLKGYYARSGSVGSYTYTLQTSGTYSTGTYYERLGTKVILTGGTVTGNVYGGGLGRKSSGSSAVTAVEAKVYGDVTVKLNETTGDNCIVMGNIYGCNNANGTPLGSVTVDIYGTYKTGTKPTKIGYSSTPVNALAYQTATDTQVNGQTYELAGVFGGGNEAAYTPTGTNITTVNIHGCSTTSIKEVYGGGNAASVPGCAVNVYEAYEIGYVYGGGNGTSGAANVGKNGNTSYGSGNATTTINGGTIYRTFAGSNTNGDIVGTATLTIADGTGTDACSKPLLGEVFGYGNKATINGASVVNMQCLTNKVGALYGGAKNADVNHNITLNINGGKYGKVFGGNDSGGTIGGSITVNVEQTQCDIEIDSLFACGNQAPYTTAYMNGETPSNYTNPTINIISCKSIGTVYGGGLGSGAVLTGSPIVNINMKNATAGTVTNALGTIGNVYGGGKGALVTGDPQVNIGTLNTLTSPHSGTVLGANITGNVFGGGEAANVTGNTTVNIGTVNYTVSTATGVVGVTIGGKVYGGGEGEMTNVTGTAFVNVGAEGTSAGTYVGNTNITHNIYGGSALGTVANTEVNLYSGTVANVFGGGEGRLQEGTVTAQSATISANTTVQLYNASVSYIYGGCNDKGTVNGKATVNLIGGSVSGDVYGGGQGNETLFGENGSVEVNVGTSTSVGSTEITGDIYGGSAFGHVNAPVVNLYKAGTLSGSVFGGGKGSSSITASVTGTTKVNMYGTTLTHPIYGGCNTKGTSANIEVTILGGTLGTAFSTAPASLSALHNILFGGGKGSATSVTGTTKVYVGTKTAKTSGTGYDYAGDANIYGNVYGGSENGGVSAVNVYLYKDVIHGNVFGGGYDTAEGKTAATTVNVDLDGTAFDCIYGTDTNKTPQTGQIFGGNNENGWPTGLSTVHVYKTVAHGTTNVRTTGKTNTTYELAAIYGGGNRAKSDAEAGTAVIIEGCNASSIAAVYGGGNAAYVMNSSVTISGTYEIGTVFGGGNGTVAAADVKGTATTVLNGGTIHDFYGGSNSQGTIGQYNETTHVSTGGTDITIDDLYIKEETGCTLQVSNIYGAGKSADVNGSVKMTLGCLSDADKIDNLYGGAQDADIKGDVVLTVTSGKFENVFGGNNAGGTIGGSIEVNIEETGCKPLIIENVYGGGNKASYTGDPVVNLKSFTAIGNVFGGGKGDENDADKGVVTGSPQVNINQTFGKAYVDNDNTKPFTQTATTLGIIGNVFGGGEIAKVVGDVSINIGTEEKVEMKSLPKRAAEEGDPEYDATAETQEQIFPRRDVKGVNIYNGTYSQFNNTSFPGNVYGGGKSADIEGDVTITIGTKDLRATTSNDKKGTKIGGNVYGGGLGENTTVTGDVLVNIGANTGTAQAPAGAGYAEITGDVYGGSAKGKVNATKSGTTFTAANEKTTQVKLYGGSVTGDVYGGGHGLDDKSADVYGAVTVEVYGGSAARVFGANNAKGSPKDDIDVKIKGGTISTAVFGGGNVATYIPTSEQTVEVEINGTNARVGSVFGGGNEAGMGDTSSGGTPVNTKVTIAAGNVTAGVYGGSNTSGIVTKNATVLVTGGKIGDGEISSTGVITYNTAKANVHGGGLGQETRVDGNVTVTIGQGTTGTAQIWGDVYGGSAKGKVNGTTVESNTHTTQVGLNSGAIYGDLYGGGLGEDNAGTTNDHPADVFGTVSVSVTGGTVSNVFGANNVLGAPQQTVGVLINKGEGTLNIQNVYGGGNNAAYTAPNATPNYPVVTLTNGTITGSVFGGGKGSYADVEGNPQVLLQGATVSTNVYGGGDLAKVIGATSVTLTSGNVGEDLYGGGNNADVTEDVTVNILGGTVTGDVYGGGAYADTQTSNWNSTTWAGTSKSALHTTHVNLLGGSVRDVYGGALGRVANAANSITAIESKVYGDVYVNLNGLVATDYDATIHGSYVQAVLATGTVDHYELKTTTTGEAPNTTTTYAKGAIVRNVFGANNAFGSPQGNVNVHVFATQNADAGHDKINLKYPIPPANNATESVYDVTAVYGGGNKAAYVPVYNQSTGATEFKTQVIIEGCSTTSIETVYGGGSAASVPETNVEIKSAYEIGTAFGGGDGHGDGNPGADIGVYKNTSNTDVRYGTGNTYTLLEGGYIHEVFGGSNERGVIKGNAKIETDDEADDCELRLGTIFNAGRNADIDGDVIAVLGCQPSTKIDAYYAGAENANVKGNVELTITSGKFGKVFGGNKTSGAIFGHIKVNIEETNCRPIEIDELYGCGDNAPYSVYGYYHAYEEDNTQAYLDEAKTIRLYKKLENGHYYLYFDSECKRPFFSARTSASDTHAAKYWGDGTVNDHTKPNYDDPELNIISATRIGKVFGGGLGSRAIVYGNPTVNINQIYGLKSNGSGGYTTATDLGQIGVDENGSSENCGVFGGGNEAKVEGNTTVNIGTKTTVDLHKSVNASGVYTMENDKPVLGANILSNVYGGGNLADVTGKTFVNICANYNTTTKKWEKVAEGEKKVTIAGNVYGGGKGVAKEEFDAGAFFCAEAMVGENNKNSVDNNNDPDYADYGTHVRIGNGTVNGSVYGGGEIGRVEFHTEVVIGFDGGTEGATKSPVIEGSVFGAGKGTNTHGYSGLVRGDSRVTIQGDAKVGHSVYGGGEMASVGKYQLDANGLPKTPVFGGKCTVTIQGYAEIGPDGMKMDNSATTGKPDDTGHVFGAGKGTLPYENVTGTPWSMENSGKVIYGAGKESDYYKFIQSLGLASNTEVTIDEHAFIKGSVYGGSENGYLQANTHVTIAGGQIGEGLGQTAPYADAAFIDPSNPETPVTTSNALAACATWTYDKATTGKPYDKYATYLKDGEYYYDAGFTKSSKGGAPIATDGHTYYGNVFGGGRGVVPFAAGQWHRAAGSVAGTTQVDITGGHILSSVYGGNENTDVGSYAMGTNGEPTTTLSSGGTCTINITGGTVGVPRTKEQIEDNPVIGNVFGAGKGDKRVLFNTWTNVGATSVNISGDAIIYGSVFGGGEDGHVINNAVTNIGGTVTTGVVGNTTEHDYSKVVIGSTGISGADGNVFGGGRGSETALTAGVVGGNVNLTIDNGNILGSVYGGGRLASVGTNFTNPTLENGDPDPLYGQLQTPDTDHGNIIVTVNDGTIGLSNSTGVNGNIYGGSRGTTSDFRLGIVRSTTINMTGGTAYASVYGGGELAQVVGSHTTSDQTLGTEINISGGTIGINGKGGATWGNVFGGGKGNTTQLEAGLVKTNTKVAVSETDATNHPTLIYHNIYGGGAYGSVGTYTYNTDNDGNLTEISGYTSGGKAEIYVTGGTIGTDGKENGMIFGSSRGDVGAPNSIHDKLAWVYDTHVAVGDTTNTTITTTTPLIKGSVYGGGENGHNYRNAYVRINGGTIGIADEAEYPYRGNVYGGGCGTDKYYENPDEETHDGNGQLYNPKAGIVQGNAIVHVTEGHIVHNVYGAGAMGSVGTMTKDNDDHLDISSGGKTTIEISGGTVGVDGTDNGNVFGAARGDETTKQTDVALVKTTDVKVSGNATVVWGNVYGGGQIGNVGTFTERAADGKYIWTSDTEKLNGLSKVTITGGETKGHVFGAGKGKANNFKCDKAMVRETKVSVSNGIVNGNVYGGGEVGRVEEDTKVEIATEATTNAPTIKGSVFGGGAGLETHGYSALVRGNATVNVEGSAKVGHSVYGGGEIASVGRYGLDAHKMPEILLDGGYCYVKVQGSAEIGTGSAGGDVFGACKGVTPHLEDKDDADRSKRPRRMTMYNTTDFPDGAKLSAAGTATGTTPNGSTWEYYDESAGLVWEYFRTPKAYDTYLQTLALATHPEVTIDGGATVNGSVYGGGEMGLTKGSVFVNILGGTITEDVYGGGALANTNTTSAVGVIVDGVPQKKTDGSYETTTVHPTTTVNLLGGSMRDAYGGGLGKVNSTDNSNDGIPAYVFGDVKVNLNGLERAEDINATTLSALTASSTLVEDADNMAYRRVNSASTVKGAIVNRVFGCNNLNGSPKKKVQVYVYATQPKGEGKKLADKTQGSYDVAAVYGGGNLAPYEPTDALLDYTVEANKETVEAARSEVYIDGCGLTSIQQVYGGGNAASAPATYVLVNRVYEIDEVFGGGNGYDPYTLNGDTYVNPGANVGYYNYTHFVKNTTTGKYEPVDNTTPDCSTKDARVANYRYGSGIARTEIKGGKIHTVYGGSNAKGNIRTKASSAYTSSFDDCPMDIDQSYGGGKDAPIDGEVEVESNCAKGIKEMFGGSKNADVDADINLYITNGSSLERVFGGNNTSGAVNGSITVTIEEKGCEPIIIKNLYAGGYLAPYSIYGYEKNADGSYKTIAKTDEDGNPINERIPLRKGDPGAATTPKNDPHIHVISATRIDNIFGGGYKATVVGSPHINVNMEPGRIPAKFMGDVVNGEYKDDNGNVLWTIDHIVTEDGDEKGDGILPIGTIGTIYGGGNEADIIGNTYVEIGTGTMHNDKGDGFVALERNAATITGNVFGGGKGKADTFTCEKAMVGVADDPDKTIGNTYITIGNGTVGTLDAGGNLVAGTGNVYGGGEVGRVENNTNVTLGIEGGTGPTIYGTVFGAGAGVNTHGYSALVRGNATVLIQGDTKVGKSVYGGGEIASVGRYKVADAAYHAAHPDVEIGLPYSTNEGGVCTVTIKGNAEIGPDNMKMVTDTGWPTDEGHVFGAGKGILPYELTNTTDNRPRRMWRVKNTDTDWNPAWGTDGSTFKDIWEYYDVDDKEPAYLKYIQSLALATTTEVTIDGKAFVKGSVYGGSMNGHVQANTHVVIDGDCQIGNGDGVNKRYDDADWAKESLAECASWPYGHDTGKTDGDGNKIYEYLPYDVYDYQPGTTKPKPASDGHTFYGNVFGGGSGLFPYKQNPDYNEAMKALGYSDGVWLRSAGMVYGNTVVDIKGGHILTSVYGGNECTDVKGTTTVNMSGGTIGVPRTVDEIKAHPVTCYLFGAGKGDQRINFNTWTNVEKAIVNITGGTIFGSVFGGGEDGHVLGDVDMDISGENTLIGTTGTSYVDGNIFGGGRGFSGEAQTAGTVGGNIDMTISGGKILGSVYGGGRLASVGTEFTAAESPNYGQFKEDDANGRYGHVTIDISGGTIGRDFVKDEAGNLPEGAEHSGNVFGASMGRLTLLNGTTNPIWPKMAQVKSTTVTISDKANIKRTVFGGGELGTVRDNATVNITGGTVGRDVYGAGYGSDDYTTHTMITVKEPKEGVTNPSSASDYNDVSYVFTPMIFAGCVGQNTYVNVSGGHVKKSVYGGGEMASVGIIDCRVKKDNSATNPIYTEGTDKYVYISNHKHDNPDNDFVLSWPYHFENVPGYFGATHVNVTGGRIGLNGEENKEGKNPFEDLDNGDVVGGGKGIVGDYNNYVFCANVGSTEVTIDYPLDNKATPQNYMDSDDIECIAGAVYGGAEDGHVMGNTKLTLKNGLVGHSIYGGGSGKGKFKTTLQKIAGVDVVTNNAPTSPATAPKQYADGTYDADIYSITAGKVFGNTEIEMTGGYVVRNVYGGGNLGSVGKGNYAGGPDDYSTAGYGEKLSDNNLWDDTNPYGEAFLNSGVSTVTITGGTVGYIDFNKVSDYTYSGLPYGNVFGGCRGESAPNIGESPRYLYCPTFFSGYVNETNVTIGTEGSSKGPKIWGSVYGGGMDGHVRRDATVTIYSGEIGRAYTGDGSAADLAKIEWSQCGNVYGAGSGTGQYKYDFNYDGDYEDVVNYTNPLNKRTTEVKETDFSTSAGSVTRFTKVEVKGGTIHRNVYGGGSLSSIGGPKIPPIDYDPYRKGDTADGHGVGKQSLNEVIISGSTATIGDETSYDANGNHVYGGLVFGASRGDETLSNPTSFASSVWTDVKVQGGTIYGDVYGGGEVGTVRQGAEVQLTGGTVKHDAYGGGKGTATVAANVGGDVLLELNKGVAEDATGCIIDRLFGANNVNGTPKGHVKVHVYATQNADAGHNKINSKYPIPTSEATKSVYDVSAVYGGGNQSAYEPTSETDGTEVIIDGCEQTSIKQVYGGGNAASTPATNVTINSVYEIDELFGGGNGFGEGNPGANVGYTAYPSEYDPPKSSKEERTEKFSFGSGVASLNIYGGRIHRVFGGSNTKGNVRQTAITMLDNKNPSCPLLVDEAYGGGKSAPMDAEAKLLMQCIPGLKAVYGGAQDADIQNDVTLNITNGTFDRVFGGNNKSGTIRGTITVNIEETGCNPIVIGQLYGGGNLAPYEAPAGKDGPTINAKSFTSIGDIYGGGYGETAVVKGDTHVNINVCEGKFAATAFQGKTTTFTVDDKTVSVFLPGHEANKIGAINNIFGGGNAAKVVGNTNIKIGTDPTVSFVTDDPDTEVDERTTPKTVTGADIRGNVYGGGNAADVTGKTNVEVGQNE